MSARWIRWFLLQMSLVSSLARPSLSQAVETSPAIQTESLTLHELPVDSPLSRLFLLSVPDRFRNRHFRIERDRSACPGPIRINESEFDGEDLTSFLRLDRSNEFELGGCLERVPTPFHVIAMPKVHIAEARWLNHAGRGERELEITVRNTLANSASCSLEVDGQSKEFLIGPETSQTHRFLVRLKKQGHFRLLIELYKFEEVMEGAYRHRVELDASSLPSRTH